MYSRATEAYRGIKFIIEIKIVLLTITMYFLSTVRNFSLVKSAVGNLFNALGTFSNMYSIVLYTFVNFYVSNEVK